MPQETSQEGLNNAVEITSFFNYTNYIPSSVGYFVQEDIEGRFRIRRFASHDILLFTCTFPHRYMLFMWLIKFLMAL